MILPARPIAKGHAIPVSVTDIYIYIERESIPFVALSRSQESLLQKL